MKLNDLIGKKICIVGCGKEGQAMLSVLEQEKITATITLAEGKEELDFKTSYPTQLGKNWLQNLEQFDVLIVSPGVPPCNELDSVASKVTTSTQIFLEEATQRGSTVIGITGSKGKSTVSSLIYTILKANNQPAYLVGNIGIPSIEFIAKAKPGVIFVLEMSSYQLLRCTVSPSIAVITSFFPDHLDYHMQEQHVRKITDQSERHVAAIDAYKAAKMHITKFQQPTDIVFYDTFTSGAKEIAEKSCGQKIATSAKNTPVTMKETKLIGEHNLRNIGLAYFAAKAYIVDEATTITAIKNFTGLPHRLESIGIYHGAEWIDDAISTTPEAAIAAIDAIGERVQTIILGGLDRDNDFTKLGKRVADSTIQTVILFPESGVRIKVAIQKAITELGMTNNELRNIRFINAHSMPEAVECCKQSIDTNVKYIPVVLLSTASPSYNMFKNFEDKGEQFTREVKA